MRRGSDKDATGVRQGCDSESGRVEGHCDESVKLRFFFLSSLLKIFTSKFLDGGSFWIVGGGGDLARIFFFSGCGKDGNIR